MALPPGCSQMCVGDAPLGRSAKLCDPSLSGYPDGCYNDSPKVAYMAASCWIPGYGINPGCDLGTVARWTRQLCVQEMKDTNMGRNQNIGTKFCARAPTGWNAQSRSGVHNFAIVDPASPNVGTPFICRRTCYEVCLGLRSPMMVAGDHPPTGQCAKYWLGPAAQDCSLTVLSFKQVMPAPAPGPRIVLKAKQDESDDCWNLPDYDSCADPSKTWVCRWNFESQRCKPLRAGAEVALKAGKAALLDNGDACMDHKECASKKCMLKDEVFQCVHESMDMSCSHDDDCQGSTCMCGSLKCCCGNYCTGDNPFEQ